MCTSSQSDVLLAQRIREGQAAAWTELIERFEGRLLAFVESRTGDRESSEDVVQETFIGFLTSLPNYDLRRPLEGYLFSIAAHKLTDHLRRRGRRPTLPLSPAGGSTSNWEPAGAARSASAIVRSGERRQFEERALAAALNEQIERWRQRGDWEKLRAIELLFIRGLSNKEVAGQLAISEQTVANYKFEFLARLRTTVRKQGLPHDVFPELYDES